MLETFFVSLISVLTYQLVGVGLFLPFELAFPKAKLRFADRAGGLIYLLATSLITAIVGTCLILTKEALHIRPLLTFHGGFGAPIIAAIAGALWVDLQFYTAHRLEHRFFWRFHAVHHSIRNLSAANSYHHWTEPFWGLTVLVPLAFVDVQIGPTLGFLAFLFRFQQFYIHSSSRPHFGPLRWLLVDNRYHRIHHSTIAAHHDKNFGAMTPLWDWVFGTIYMPKSSEWPDVGLKEFDQPESLLEWATLPWRQATNRVGGVKLVPEG